MRTILLISVTLSLGACQHADYCTDSHPIAYRQASPEWESNYRMCRLMEAGIRGPQRPSIDVYIRN